MGFDQYHEPRAELLSETRTFARLFESGQDLSLGYLSHDAEDVNLYLEQSF